MSFRERNRNQEMQRSTKRSSGLRQSNTVDRSFKRAQRRSGVFMVNFEHISHLALVFLLLTLSR